MQTKKLFKFFSFFLIPSFSLVYFENINYISSEKIIYLDKNNNSFTSNSNLITTQVSTVNNLKTQYAVYHYTCVFGIWNDGTFDYWSDYELLIDKSWFGFGDGWSVYYNHLPGMPKVIRETRTVVANQVNLQNIQSYLVSEINHTVYDNNLLNDNYNLVISGTKLGNLPISIPNFKVSLADLKKGTYTQKITTIQKDDGYFKDALNPNNGYDSLTLSWLITDAKVVNNNVSFKLYLQVQSNNRGNGNVFTYNNQSALPNSDDSDSLI